MPCSRLAQIRGEFRTSARENGCLGIVDLEVCRMEFVPDRTCECNWDKVDKVGRKALGGGGHPEEKCNELCAPAPTPLECETQLEGSRVGFLPSPPLKPSNCVVYC